MCEVDKKRLFIYPSVYRYPMAYISGAYQPNTFFFIVLAQNIFFPFAFLLQYCFPLHFGFFSGLFSSSSLLHSLPSVLVSFSRFNFWVKNHKWLWLWLTWVLGLTSVIIIAFWKPLRIAGQWGLWSGDPLGLPPNLSPFCIRDSNPSTSFFINLWFLLHFIFIKCFWFSFE